MSRRRWISILALLGVLLHAGAIVRHHAAMTGATLQYRALLTDLAQICHGGATGGDLAAADLPYVPKPSDAQNGCPICSGLGPAFALAAPDFVAASPPLQVAAAVFSDQQDTYRGSHAVCPPARGPPAFA